MCQHVTSHAQSCHALTPTLAFLEPTLIRQHTISLGDLAMSVVAHLQAKIVKLRLLCVLSQAIY